MADQDSARIAKVLARAGLASRRDAEGMIAEGRVAVNGRVIDSPALTVGPSDRIEVDGRPLPPPEPPRLWRYHKPAGLVTTARDEEGRATVFDNLPAGMPRVMTVGRLDLTSEGLLLLTNDGDLKRRMELPSTGWLRRYRVRVHGTPDEARLAPLRQGIVIEGEAFQPMEVHFDRQQGANAWLTVGLREGRNREVRRAMEAVGLVVGRLIRISYGPFQLGDLAPGGVEEVPARVLRDQVGLAEPDAGGPRAARGPERGSGKPGKGRPDRGADKGRPGPARGEGPRGAGRRSEAEAEARSGGRRPRAPGGKSPDARGVGPRGHGAVPARGRSGPAGDAGKSRRRPGGASGDGTFRSRPESAGGPGDARPPKDRNQGAADARPASRDGAAAGRGRRPAQGARADRPGKAPGRSAAPGKGTARARDGGTERPRGPGGADRPRGLAGPGGAERPRGPGRPKDTRAASAGRPDRPADRPGIAGKAGGGRKPAVSGEARGRGAADASRPRPDRGKPAAGAKPSAGPGARRETGTGQPGGPDAVARPVRRPSGPAPTHFRPPPPALRARVAPDGPPDASDPSQSLGRRRRPTRPRSAKPPRTPRRDRTPPERT
ncbi:MAG: pseudouridine synthase [Alkalilacustris sp.]